MRPPPGPPGPYPVPYPAGDWSAAYPLYPSVGLSGGYNLSSTDASPLSASTASPGPRGGSPLTASAGIDRFSFSNSADAGAMGGTWPAPIGGYYDWSGAIRTSAQGSWQFRPTGSSLEVSIDSYFRPEYFPGYSGLTIQLLDLTDATPLLSIDRGINEIPRRQVGNYTFDVNPNIVYEFVVSGWSHTYDADSAIEQVTASIVSVVEPSVAFLLSFGLVGLAVIRKKIR